MEWLIAHYAEILLAAGVLERIAKETPEDFKLLGIPVGKYDNQVSDAVKVVLKAAKKAVTGK